MPLAELQPYLWVFPAQGLPEIGDATNNQEPIHWQSLFGNEQPVEIEIGFGKGAFLVSAAALHPAINFFGIEISRKHQLFTATRLVKRKLANVRLVCADARDLFRHWIPPASVQAIHVYFPDPWWKKRHHKRRVFTPDFVASCCNALRRGGRLLVATDVPESLAMITDLCSQEARLRLAPHSTSADDLEYVTNFERKAVKQGRPVARAVYQRFT